jgi:hypothetical protein
MTPLLAFFTLSRKLMIRLRWEEAVNENAAMRRLSGDNGSNNEAGTGGALRRCVVPPRDVSKQERSVKQ